MKNLNFVSFGILAVGTLLVLGLKNWLPPQVPLLYGRTSGEEQLVPTFGLIGAILVALAVTLTNIFLAAKTTDMSIKKTLTIASFFVTFLVVITITKIIFLVGFF